MELAWRARRRNALVTWPDAVDERLDLLVAAGLAAGENVNRSQLLAALVINARLSPDAIADILRAYRTMSTDELETANHTAAEHWPKARRTGPRRGTDQTPRSATRTAAPSGSPATTNEPS
ncbi:hypothetical protein SAMN05216371_0009 [Streptomyces sp. TLI_053]|uniref:hypothetical protein n=1 Tax=Streptomyces sp. TLI_053 TaxID=1855352 RepID=UPI00087D288F|nr:hypothetical protein [Streptomyces sp. TLI_053]SDS48006.1 hypothetical protein SAMN05216371_0009 [Streptomyces sp. TLI_053]